MRLTRLGAGVRHPAASQDHPEEVYACEFLGAPGRSMATASADAILLWDLETRRCIARGSSLAFTTDLAGGDSQAFQMHAPLDLPQPDSAIHHCWIAPRQRLWNLFKRCGAAPRRCWVRHLCAHACLRVRRASPAHAAHGAACDLVM